MCKSKPSPFPLPGKGAAFALKNLAGAGRTAAACMGLLACAAISLCPSAGAQESQPAPSSQGLHTRTGAYRPFSSWTKSPGTAAQESPSAGFPAGRTGPAQPGNMASEPARTTLDEIFKLLSQRQKQIDLNLWFPGTTLLGDAEIAQGAAIAEGIALRAGNTPVSVTSQPAIVPGKLNVISGTLDQLGGMLSADEVKAIPNGYLRLRSVSNHPNTHVLLITGRTASGLDSAILTLGIAREKLPGVSTAAIREVILPKSPPFLRREPLRAEASYTFQQLREIGTAMLILPNRDLRLELMLPGDFSLQAGGNFQLDLHFSLHTRLLQNAERVSVKVNDQAGNPVTGSAVSTGEGKSNVRLDLPANLFRQGRNVVEITFPANGDNLQVYADSTLTLPSFGAPPTLPDLQITTRTVYPLIGQPDGSEILVYLGERDANTVESAWTFLAKLAQMSNTLLYAAEFSSVPYTGNKHVIAIGSRKSLPPAYQAAIPPEIFQTFAPAAPPPKAEGISLKEYIMELQERLSQKEPKSSPDLPAPAASGTTLAATTPASTPTPTQTPAPTWAKSERGYLGCTPPKKETHGWLLLLSAESPALLRQRTRDLVSPEFWDKISGERICWNDSPSSLRFFPEPDLNSAANRHRAAGRMDGNDRMVEMPLGKQFTVRNWIIAIVVTFLVLIVTSLSTISRLLKSGGHRN